MATPIVDNRVCERGMCEDLIYQPIFETAMGPNFSLLTRNEQKNMNDTK